MQLSEKGMHEMQIGVWLTGCACSFFELFHWYALQRLALPLRVLVLCYSLMVHLQLLDETHGLRCEGRHGEVK